MDDPRQRLDGLKLIAARLRLSPRTVRRFASPRTPLELRLPLFRLALDGSSGRLSAYVDELDEWEERFRARGLLSR